MYKKEFEKQFQKRVNKEKSKLEDDSFIDLEMIYSVGISVILHVVIFYLIWNVIIDLYGPSYAKVAKKLNVQPDIVFRLSPDKPQKGEFSFEDAQKFYNLKEYKQQP